MQPEAYIKAPTKIPLLIRAGIRISRRVTKKDLLAPKLLAWYPKVALSSGVLEALVAHGRKDLDPRILKLMRIQASALVSCPFCMDMNSFEYAKAGLTEAEVRSLAEGTDPAQVPTFTSRERLAVEYTRRISETPANVPPAFADLLKQAFTEREIVILASTAAQVNYWARMLIALGVPPAGFSDSCPAPAEPPAP
jgi:alkylhydroperoxidase family enzyme